MTGAVVAAAALTGGAGVLALPITARPRLRAVVARSHPVRRAALPVSHRVTGSAVAAMAIVTGAAVGPVLAVVVALYGWAAVRSLHRGRTRRAHRAFATAAHDALSGLADDLRAGSTPAAALTVALGAVRGHADELTDEQLRQAEAAAELGAGVAEALDQVAHPALRTQLGPLAVVWRLTDAGVPLAALVERVDAELRARAAAARRAAAQLSAANATAWMLSALPVLGLGLGHALGAQPLHTLLATPAGGACLVAAVALQLAGSAWLRRLVQLEQGA